MKSCYAVTLCICLKQGLSVCSSNWLEPYCVDQGGLELSEIFPPICLSNAGYNDVFMTFFPYLYLNVSQYSVKVQISSVISGGITRIQS